MTIAEKITYLRTVTNTTQEQLAERMGVSRQSVSKWEMGQSVPQLDKIIELCDLFSVSADTMLRDEIAISFGEEESVGEEKPKYPGKYFGTDGYRGEANITLTSDNAYKVGRFLGWYFSSPLSGNIKPNYRPRIVLGKDTRRSSYMLEYAIAAGITASGADVYMLHVITTPGVSFVTRQDEFDCGIMITASHNPFYDNGIKIINRYGEKIDDSVTALIEAYIDGDLSKLNLSSSDIPLAIRDRIGCIVDYVAGRNRYVGYLISLASHSYKNLKIGLDCANGASWSIAKAIFDALGAQTYTIATSPDGTNINNGCGSTHIEGLCELVREKHLDMGFAFDGDADRCIAVDENGNIIDGDRILYILASRLKSRGMLHNDTVVLTVMSNLGLFKAFDAASIKYEVTAVGDRFVYEAMQKNNYQLGGEQSGHIIIKKYATTGDALLTAIMLTEEMKDNKLPLSKLSSDVKILPQLTRSITVFDKSAVMNDERITATCERIKKALSGDGRLLVRASGTEPVIRIMVEAGNIELCEEYVREVEETIRKQGLAK